MDLDPPRAPRRMTGFRSRESDSSPPAPLRPGRIRHHRTRTTRRPLCLKERSALVGESFSCAQLEFSRRAASAASCPPGGCRVSETAASRALLENCIAVQSILYSEQLQATKSQRWMPWRQMPMKDVGGCDKPRGAADQALIRGSPNGETRLGSCPVTLPEHIGQWEGTGGTETSKYPRKRKQPRLPE